MFSGYAKRRGEYRSVEEYIRRSNGLERIARFYNSWHAFQQEHPSRTLIVSYEQMRKAPKDTFARLLEFGFDENVSDAILDEALEFYSFESQKARERQFSSDENSHFHYKGKTSYRDEMGEETHEWIQRELRSRIPSFETWQALTKVPVRDGL
jgi:hypothetical protein